MGYIHDIQDNDAYFNYQNLPILPSINDSMKIELRYFSILSEVFWDYECISIHLVH